MLPPIYETTRRHVPENINVHSDRCESLRSGKFEFTEHSVGGLYREQQLTTWRKPPEVAIKLRITNSDARRRGQDMRLRTIKGEEA
jgi:hypothetical protein